MSAIKNTLNGDMCSCSIGELEEVIKSHKNSGEQSEMNR